MEGYKEGYVLLHIGLDDIDSIFYGCTTHFAYQLIKNVISSDSIEFIDYPNLVRLNPSIPFKTRGNGAVALRVMVSRSYKDAFIRTIVNLLTDYISRYNVGSKRNPGVAIVEGEVPVELVRLYTRALTDYVHVDYVKRLIGKVGNVDLPLGMSRGVIGALAAIGWPQGADCTYELLAYRVPSASGSRCIDWNSVRTADARYGDRVFNNYDHATDTPLLAPHGADPVLLGIRGNEPEVLVSYLSDLRVCEPIDGWVIFRTNQGTDAHLNTRTLDEVRPYRTLCLDIIVANKPMVIEGGHVLLRIGDERYNVNAVFYKDTSLTNVARVLNVGDEVTICGSVKQWSDYSNTINVEKVYIKRKVIMELRNPRCPRCGKRMKSSGHNRGFKCIKCGFKTTEVNKEVVVRVDAVNMGYTAAVHKMKHLTKPLSRYGKERSCMYTKPVGKWIEVLG